MRTENELYRGFLGGLLVAFAATAVTVLTVGIVRRTRGRRLAAAETPIGIDSIAPDPVSLALQPAPEGARNPVPKRLESEANDVMIKSQRW